MTVFQFAICSKQIFISEENMLYVVDPVIYLCVTLSTSPNLCITYMVFMHQVLQSATLLTMQEKDLNAIREAKIRQEMFDREASLHRARREASLADGISWGMGEDAIEEEEVGDR